MPNNLCYACADAPGIKACANSPARSCTGPQVSLSILCFLSSFSPKPPSHHSILSHHRPTSEMPFKLRFAGGKMKVRLKWYLYALSPHQKKKKKCVRAGPPPL